METTNEIEQLVNSGLPLMVMLFPIIGVLLTIVLPIMLACYMGAKIMSARHTEKMAMIEKGAIIPEAPPNPNRGLQRGMLLLGLGLGAFVGASIGWYMFQPVIVPIFIGSVLLFGGMGQVAGSLMARRLNKNDETKREDTSFDKKSVTDE